ncbi:hypothetical protein QLQ85_08900 [Halomonas sp. M4R5S39]|uniref:hypothetical protein n=1 Tax=Halomonas kalidii TaxID=3043293 RepID=UPI0024A9F0FB|nr:hypothetical protein [Halomonas kalidii]MDI5984908.1 hypothetical protein [Halomonas kalidii]
MSAIDAVSTAGITPPAAFHRLRADLHAAAGADRIAAQRAYREAAEMRRRADFFRDAMELHAGTGLGDWYAKLSARFDNLETELLAEGCEIEDGYGILGGA